jgi:hypothetical protein
MRLLEGTQMSLYLAPSAFLTFVNLLKQALSRALALSIPNPNKIIHHIDK